LTVNGEAQLFRALRGRSVQIQAQQRSAHNWRPSFGNNLDTFKVRGIADLRRINLILIGHLKILTVKATFSFNPSMSPEIIRHPSVPKRSTALARVLNVASLSRHLCLTTGLDLCEKLSDFAKRDEILERTMKGHTFNPKSSHWITTC
jgi:hypothetical protein